MYNSYEGLPGKKVLCVQLPGFIDHRLKVIKAKSGWKFFIQDSARKFPGNAHPFLLKLGGWSVFAWRCSRGLKCGVLFGWILGTGGSENALMALEWHKGHIEGIFWDLFSCSFLTKDFLGKQGLSAPCAPKEKNDGSRENGDTHTGNTGNLIVISGIFFLYISYDGFPGKYGQSARSARNYSVNLIYQSRI